TSVKPRPASILATSIARGLSGFLTLTNTLPLLGRRTPAASCDLTNASANDSPTPITSPVDFISGPRIVSTPGNLMNGNTASLTEKYGGTISRVMPWLASDWPTMQRAAILASGRPVAFDTYGTVRDARGLTSSTKTTGRLSPSYWIANWTFISPTTCSAFAITTVCRRSSSCSSGDSE